MISWDASRAAPVEVSASGNKDLGSSYEANGSHSDSFVFKTTLFPEKHTVRNIGTLLKEAIAAPG